MTTYARFFCQRCETTLTPPTPLSTPPPCDECGRLTQPDRTSATQQSPNSGENPNQRDLVAALNQVLQEVFQDPSAHGSAGCSAAFLDELVAKATQINFGDTMHFALCIDGCDAVWEPTVAEYGISVHSVVRYLQKKQLFEAESDSIGSADSLPFSAQQLDVLDTFSTPQAAYFFLKQHYQRATKPPNNSAKSADISNTSIICDTSSLPVLPVIRSVDQFLATEKSALEDEFFDDPFISHLEDDSVDDDDNDENNDDKLRQLVESKPFSSNLSICLTSFYLASINPATLGNNTTKDSITAQYQNTSAYHQQQHTQNVENQADQSQQQSQPQSQESSSSSSPSAVSPRPLFLLQRGDIPFGKKSALIHHITPFSLLCNLVTPSSLPIATILASQLHDHSSQAQPFPLSAPAADSPVQIWPYLMTDSKNIAPRGCLSLLLRWQDSLQLLASLLASSSSSQSSSPRRAYLLLEPNHTCCCICQCEYAPGHTVVKLACKHTIHRDCFLPWGKKHSTCPVCRFQLPVEKANQGIIDMIYDDASQRRPDEARQFYV